MDELTVSNRGLSKKKVGEKVTKTVCKTDPNPTKKQTVNNLLIKFPLISRRLICLAVGCNRSGTYKQSHESKMKSRDQALIELITKIRLDNPWYGHRRLKLSLLQDHNQKVGINRIRRVCNLHSLHPKMRKKQPPKARPQPSRYKTSKPPQRTF